MAAFYIQNPWTGLVIDIGIGENAQKASPGMRLQANAMKTSAPGNAYQLWTFYQFPWMAGTSKITFFYYWLQNANGNLVIDIAESGNESVPGQPTTLKQGSPLDAWTWKGPQAGLTAANQLWSFRRDVSGYYYIVNWLTGFVIDIAEGSSGKDPTTGPASLDAWALKANSPDNQNQLWKFVPTDGTPVDVPSETPEDAGTVNTTPGSVKK